ncbi:MAG: anti-sigma factor antagonist [Actinomycetota bacterium]|nr:anti-sigma factor antagonist [Actinomycetota bacterium]
MPSPETPGFSIKIEAEQSAPRVVVTGELDLLTSPQLKDQLAALAEQKPSRLILDLTGVSFFDSSALNVVLHAQREAGEQSYELAVVPSAAVSRVIDLTGVADHLTVVYEPPA